MQKENKTVQSLLAQIETVVVSIISSFGRQKRGTSIGFQACSASHSAQNANALGNGLAVACKPLKLLLHMRSASRASRQLSTAPMRQGVAPPLLLLRMRMLLLLQLVWCWHSMDVCPTMCI